MSVLRIVTLQIPNDLNQCALTNFQPRQGCRFPGALAETLFVAFTSVKLNYELVPQSVVQPFFVDGGKLFQLVDNGTVDTAALMLIETKFRREQFEFSFPLIEFKPVFVTAAVKPGVGSSVWLPLEVFTLHLWTILFIVFWIIQLALYLSRKILKTAPSFAFKSFILIMASLVVLFTNLYKGKLLGELLHKSKQHMFRDSWEMLDLIQEKELTLVMNSPHYWYHQSIYLSDHPYFKRLKRAIITNPIVFDSNYSKLVQMVAGGHYVMPIGANDFEYLKNTNCNLDAIAGSDLPVYSAGLIFRKNSSWVFKVNEALIKAQEHTESVMKKYYEQIARAPCPVPGQSIGHEPLGIVPLSGAFGSFLLLCFISLMALVLEILWERNERIGRKEPKNEAVSEAEVIVFQLKELLTFETDRRVFHDFHGMIRKLNKRTKKRQNSVKIHRDKTANMVL